MCAINCVYTANTPPAENNNQFTQPNNSRFYKSSLFLLPHTPAGQYVVVIPVPSHTHTHTHVHAKIRRDCVFVPASQPQHTSTNTNTRHVACSGFIGGRRSAQRSTCLLRNLRADHRRLPGARQRQRSSSPHSGDGDGGSGKRIGTAHSAARTGSATCGTASGSIDGDSDVGRCTIATSDGGRRRRQRRWWRQPEPRGQRDPAARRRRVRCLR